MGEVWEPLKFYSSVFHTLFGFFGFRETIPFSKPFFGWLGWVLRFRDEIVGDTDPATAAPHSIRGQFFKQWQTPGTKWESFLGIKTYLKLIKTLKALNIVLCMSPHIQLSPGSAWRPSRMLATTSFMDLLVLWRRIPKVEKCAVLPGTQKDYLRPWPRRWPGSEMNLPTTPLGSCWKTKAQTSQSCSLKSFKLFALLNLFWPYFIYFCV